MWCKVPDSYSRCGTTSQNNRLTMFIVWMHTLTNTPCSRIRNVVCTAEANYIEFNQRISPWFTCSACDVSWRESEKAIHLHKSKQNMSFKTMDGVELQSNNINGSPLMSLTMWHNWLRYLELVYWRRDKKSKLISGQFNVKTWTQLKLKLATD